jgi:hypothetical protein
MKPTKAQTTGDGDTDMDKLNDLKKVDYTFLVEETCSELFDRLVHIAQENMFTETNKSAFNLMGAIQAMIDLRFSEEEKEAGFAKLSHRDRKILVVFAVMTVAGKNAIGKEKGE